jgi:dolichyl-phosphate-mannose-protein mannosyltransferase
VIVPVGETKFYKSPFLRDFWHLNVAMMTSNNALIPDPDKEDMLASSPMDWPWLHLGLRMCGWGDTQVKYYLVGKSKSPMQLDVKLIFFNSSGNPIVWWSSTASLFLCVLTLLVYVLRIQGLG